MKFLMGERELVMAEGKLAVYGAERFKLLEKHWPRQYTEGRFQEILKDRPMADGHLETLGHREAAETVEQCCSDQITHQW